MFLMMDKKLTVWASPRRYSAPVAKSLYDEDQASRYYGKIAGAPAPDGGRADARGASIKEKN